MLAQALYPSQALVYPNSGEEVEAAAANKAWSALTRDVTPETGASESHLKSALKKSLELSTQTFTDLLVQIEEMDSEPSLDAYAWETMSESLVRSSLSFGRCCTSTPARNLAPSVLLPSKILTATFFCASKSFLAWIRQSPIVSFKWLLQKQSPY